MANVDELVAEWRAMGPVAWAESPHGWLDVDGQPIRLAPWQRAVLGAWEAHKDAVTTLGISCVKKTGKTLLNGVLLAWRWLALPGEHFAVGNDLDQSAGRQFAEIAALIRRHPYLRRNVKAGKSELTFIPTGSIIRALAADAAGNAGANHLTASHTEAWGIVYEGGIRAYEELTPPPGRLYGLPALRVCDSYAGYEGESETWHTLVDRGLAGERISDDWPIYQSGGLLLFHAEGESAQRLCFRGTPEEAASYYAEQRADLREGTYIRLHENRRTATESRFITGEQYDACVDNTLAPLPPGSDPDLFIGLDLATKSDCAALVGLYVDNDLGQVVTALHRVWKPARGQLVSLSEIEAYLLRLNDDYRLAAVYYDPYQAAFMAERLKGDMYLKEYAQTVPNLAHAASTLYSLFVNRRIRIYPDADLRKHVLAAAAKVVGTDEGAYRLAKRTGKIDLAAALSFAAVPAWRYCAPYAETPADETTPEAGELPEAERGRAWVLYTAPRLGAVYVRGVGDVAAGWAGWVELNRARELVAREPRDWHIETIEPSA